MNRPVWTYLDTPLAWQLVGAPAAEARPRPQRLLFDSLVAAYQTRPEHPAIVAGGKAHSYADLYDAASRLATALQARGLTRGDRVAIYMDNGFSAAVGVFGALLAGGVFMVVNPQTKAEKLRYELEDSGARFLLAQGNLATELAPAVRGLGVKVVLEGATMSGAERWEDLLTTLPHYSDPGTIPTDLAALVYTSGSTGHPKGVMMSHQAMVFTTGSLIEYLRLEPNLKILNLLPLSFDYGLYQLLMAARLGATLVLEKGFAFPGAIVRTVREEGVEVFPGVPTIFKTLLALDDKRPLVLESVLRVTNTAAALPAELVPRLQRIFPNALIYKMYGLTECKRVCYLEPELVLDKGTSVGKAIPGTEAFVLDDADRPVAPGEVGVLHVRGPHVMLGYWNAPEKTREMLKPGKLPGERILCTHDRFRMDKEGFLYFVGRTDEIIKTRGEKVSPVEVENVLNTMPGVHEAAVVGVEDPLLGQRIRAHVVLADGADLSEHDIKVHCADHLESFMVPSEVRLERSLPKLSNGKLNRKALAD